jgi:hypothetical protein
MDYVNISVVNTITELNDVSIVILMCSGQSSYTVYAKGNMILLTVCFHAVKCASSILCHSYGATMKQDRNYLYWFSPYLNKALVSLCIYHVVMT